VVTMTEQAELAFVKNLFNAISSQPVIYPDDYQASPQDSLKRIPVLPLPLPDPPERKQDAVTSTEAIQIIIKSLKPPQSYILSVQSTDTITDIKSHLSSESGAPPADVQRLLLKGKALADGKLLKEYNVKEGDTINLMVKPGFEWDPSQPSVPPNTVPFPSTSSLVPEEKPSRSHQRLPSVVLSPSPNALTPLGDDKPVDIPLTLDSSTIVSPSSINIPVSSYQITVSQPKFWEQLLTFLIERFTTQDDAYIAFEDFLRASKGVLSASEIAKIRDHVGVVGMAGT